MKFKKNINHQLVKFSTAIFSIIIVIIITQNLIVKLNPLESLELKHIDERFLNRGIINIKDTSQIIIVEINQDTYDGIPAPFNSWPWPRSYFAKVINNLNNAGAKVIGIDLLMSNPDKFSSQNDSILFNIIKKNKNVVVAGKIETSLESNRIFQTNEDVNVQIIQPNYQIKKYNENYGNIFYKADNSIGLVNMNADNDGVHRRYLPFIYSSVTENRIPTFAFSILNKYYNLPNNYISINQKKYFYFNNKKIPKYDNNSILINFYGSSRTFPYYNFLDILDDNEFTTNDELQLKEQINTWSNEEYGLLHSNIFKDKIILIGSTLPEDKDIIPISFAQGLKKGDNQIYGVEFHANMIQNVLSNNFITKENKLTEIILIFILTILSFYFSSFLKEIKTDLGLLIEALNILLIIIFVFILRMFSFYLFNNFDYLFILTSPSLGIAVGYVVSTAYHFISERQQKSLVKGMFSQYVDSSIVDELIKNPDKLKLGGERKILTVLFSDIEDFSTFSEKMNPEELVSFLNEYFSEMSKIIFENKGTLNKFIGDGILTFWGAPIYISEHAYFACKSALEMQRKLTILRNIWIKQNKPEIKIRIGINTGNMIIGNIGGLKKFDYTIMGDNVNIASRLENANKEYKSQILISESTYELVKEKFIIRELDLIIVKGKTKPLRIYELIGFQNDPISEEKIKSLNYFTEGLIHYRKKNFSEALELFQKCNSNNCEDEPSKIYIERCKYFLKNPPDKNWNGVFIFQSK
ncbi:MAG: adenylate/guanylate cyclase domain-containing protein [Ignavibacterium sp.]